ncbi:MAG: hypothetical protein ACLRZ7_06015 [Lachnospiraceae bacterium]
MLNNKLSKVILPVAIVFFTALIYTAEFNFAQGGTKETEKEKVESWTFYADLTHDGKNEKVVVDASQLEQTQNVTVTVYDIEGETEIPIWSDVAGIPHVGWNSYYLYKQDGEMYLIRYNPSLTNTGANYRYKVFWLKQDGTEEAFAGNSIIFHLTNQARDLDPEKIIAFVDEVNSYLKNSILLVSTYDGNAVYSTSENQIIMEETLPWTKEFSYLFQGNETLIEKLRKIKIELEKSS